MYLTPATVTPHSALTGSTDKGRDMTPHAQAPISPDDPPAPMPPNNPPPTPEPIDPPIQDPPGPEEPNPGEDMPPIGDPPGGAPMQM